MLKIKLIAILSIFGLVGIVLSSSHQFSSKAQTDEALDAIADYKTWTKITKEAIVVKIDESALVGSWSVVIDGSSLLPGYNSGVPRVITSQGTTRIITPTNETRPPKPEKKKPISPHQPDIYTFGEVYANDLAKAEVEKEKPEFPVGSIIIREKNLTRDAETPETVIAMIKREKGFSKKTGDWEFFVFNGKDLKIQSRETKGNCAACHTNARETDWVFLEEIKRVKTDETQ